MSLFMASMMVRKHPATVPAARTVRGASVADRAAGEALAGEASEAGEC